MYLHYSFALQEFKACLQAAEVGLTRKDINLLMGCATFTADNLIDYAEFVPVATDMLVARFEEQAGRTAVSASNEQLRKFVAHCFRHFDVEGAHCLLQCLFEYMTVRLQ